MNNHLGKDKYDEGNDEGKDVWLYRMIIGVLGIALIASVFGAIMLAMNGGETPEVLVALGSAAIGGLAGYLAPNPSNK